MAPALRSASLFSGIGGLDLAAETAFPGLSPVVYVERDSYAAACLLARMDESSLAPAPIWCGDVADLDWRPWRGVVDCVVAGFPCQPASVAGRRRGTADDRWLWPEVERAVRELEPKFVIVENVPGVLNVDDGDAFGDLLDGLAALGFDAEWGCLAASAVGAPQHRERLFLLAYAPGFLLEVGGGLGRHPDEELQTASGVRARLFPPGPAGYAAGWLEPEPCVLRAATGAPGRVDRLRGCGNGVVPLQGAVALGLLAARAR